MNLWVRSQDKKSLVKVDNLYISVGNYICYYVEKGKEVPNTYYRPSGELGRYESEERALEVLDEIQNKLLNSRYVDIRNGANDYISGYANNLIVYEMPKE